MVTVQLIEMDKENHMMEKVIEMEVNHMVWVNEWEKTFEMKIIEMESLMMVNHMVRVNEWEKTFEMKIIEMESLVMVNHMVRVNEWEKTIEMKIKIIEMDSLVMVNHMARVIEMQRYHYPTWYQDVMLYHRNAESWCKPWSLNLDAERERACQIYRHNYHSQSWNLEKASHPEREGECYCYNWGSSRVVEKQHWLKIAGVDNRPWPGASCLDHFHLKIEKMKVFNTQLLRCICLCCSVSGAECYKLNKEHVLTHLASCSSHYWVYNMSMHENLLSIVSCL